MVFSFCLNWSPAPNFWHPGRIQLPQLCSSMNSKSLLPVTVDAHYQRVSVTLLSTDKLSASLEEQSFMGEGQEDSEIRNIALSASESRKLLVLQQSPGWFLCQWLSYRNSNSTQGGFSRREVPWMRLLSQMSGGKLDGAMVTQLSWN